MMEAKGGDSSPESAVETKKAANDEEEFQLDLKTLDGYDLPGSEGEGGVKERQHRQPSTSKKQKKKKAKEILGLDYRDREEKRLEQLLFGDVLKQFGEKSRLETLDNLASLSESGEGGDVEATGGRPATQGEIPKDSPPASTVQDAVPEDVYGKSLGLETVTGKRKAAWVDDDDEEIRLKDAVAAASRGRNTHSGRATSETNYKQYLEKKFCAVHGQKTPKWAELGRKKNTDDDDEEEYPNLSKTAVDLLTKDSTSLPKNILKVSRLRDINKEFRAEGKIIKSVEFHKKQSVALVAGNAGIATLFQIDGKTNAKIQSINFDRFPIHKARFSADGEEFIITSPLSGNVQVHNLVTGKNRIIPHNREMEKSPLKNFIVSPDGKLIAFQGRFGYIFLMSARSKEWIGSLKMNGEVQAMTFNPDGSRLYSHGEFGEVFIWDMNTRDCVHKFNDDGCVLGTSIAVSPTQQFLACGSSCGVVNVYNTSKLENTVLPKPEKVFLNLVTSVDGIHFHGSCELMSMYSTSKVNAIRLAHFPSMTVFQNFPDHKKGTSVINSMDFSPNGGYMGVGLNNGSAQLFRLHHYGQY